MFTNDQLKNFLDLAPPPPPIITISHTAALRIQVSIFKKMKCTPKICLKLKIFIRTESTSYVTNCKC